MIEIYTLRYSKSRTFLLKLLEDHKLTYKEYRIGYEISLEDFKKKFGKNSNTSPHIEINGQYVGGYYELCETLRIK